jgi:hypothetical protein
MRLFILVPFEKRLDILILLGNNVSVLGGSRGDDDGKLFRRDQKTIRVGGADIVIYVLCSGGQVKGPSDLGHVEHLRKKGLALAKDNIPSTLSHDGCGAYQRVLGQPLSRTHAAPGSKSVRSPAVVVHFLINGVAGTVLVAEKAVWHEEIRLVVLGLVIVNGPGVGEDDGAFW